MAGTITTFAPSGALESTGLLPYGVTRLLSGLAFCVGILAVIIAGAELFTGNNLLVMAWASHKVSTRALLYNWILVFVGNFAGAFFMACL
ncbi:formate/nitrite transporter family protein, partial [Methylobacterium nigriterrae]|uniref:formate/nitrite transporter family protein n=1 Tax=Methylobacterium nigriterrae TaxID=3127512 RepID=UPI0030136CCF